MPTWLIILITMLGTLISAGITIFLYCKYKSTSTCSNTSSIFLHTENPKVTKLMFVNSPCHLIISAKIKATYETVKEALDMLRIDFSDCDKHKICRNSKDGSKIATTPV